LDGFSCIAFPMFPKYCKFLVDIVDYLMWFFFFIRYEWRMIWFYSLFFSFIQQGAFYTKIWCLHASSREAFRAIWVLLLLRAEFGLWNCMES
jgi:hypothetical protein